MNDNDFQIARMHFWTATVGNLIRCDRETIVLDTDITIKMANEILSAFDKNFNHITN